MDERNNVISAQDYDCWGYVMDGRSYDNDPNCKYKFTGKERDNESTYDYFGARYYMSRVANWTSPDPLFEKHVGWTPYNYVLRNPLRLVDPDGKQAYAEEIMQLYTGLLQGQIEQEMYLKMSSQEVMRHHGMTKEQYSRGNTVQTGDEMLLAGLFTSGFTIGEKTVATGLTLETENLVKSGLTISEHAATRMLENNITEKMIEKTLEKGSIYYGHESGALTYILKESFCQWKKSASRTESTNKECNYRHSRSF